MREQAFRTERPSTTPHVLVVEDEDALATLLQYNLDKEGYRVVLAGDGEEALTLVDEQQPDLVVLDWMLPKVSGIEVCRRIRNRAETRNLPVIMLTARGRRATASEGWTPERTTTSSSRSRWWS
jgi:two-component system phosphate regulon response regulator PhoB